MATPMMLPQTQRFVEGRVAFWPSVANLFYYFPPFQNSRQVCENVISVENTEPIDALSFPFLSQPGNNPQSAKRNCWSLKISSCVKYAFRVASFHSIMIHGFVRITDGLVLFSALNSLKRHAGHVNLFLHFPIY